MSYTEKKAKPRATSKGVDPKLISAVDMRNLCRATLEAVRRFYDNPENLAAYRRWKAEREHRDKGEI